MTNAPAAPQSTDAAVAFVNQILASLIDNMGATAVEVAAETAEPWLADPVIKQIFEFIVGELAGKLSIDAQGIASQIVFTVQNNTKLGAAVVALKAYQVAQAAGGDTSAALQNAVNGWGNIIHWGGIAAVTNSNSSA